MFGITTDMEMNDLIDDYESDIPVAEDGELVLMNDGTYQPKNMNT